MNVPTKYIKGGKIIGVVAEQVAPEQPVAEPTKGKKTGGKKNG